MKGSKICFTEDIINEVSNSMGIDKVKVEGVYGAMVKYIHYLVRDTDSVAIYIRNFGTLYTKAAHVSKRLRYYKKENNLKRVAIFERKKEKIDINVKLFIDGKKPSNSRHIGMNKLKSAFYTCGKTIEEIEEIQNEENN